jgi:para-aminobenzoate synthetase/4-amino-4-deoxychorismate lyase
MNEPKINEILLRDRDEWLHFTDPSQIITAKTLNDVLPALAEIEDRVEQDGLYAAGFLSYESATAFDAAHQTKPGTGFPYLWFGLYPAPRTVNLPRPTQPKAALDWRPTVDRNTYNGAIEKIKEYIADGQTYQVNYTMRLQTGFHLSAWDFFLHLAQAQNKYAAYIDTGRYVICSASPELFFELDGNSITGRPMKGTVKRGHTTQEDQAQAEWLQNSEKNRAENVMIVDMIRNDLGRIAKTGTVQVPELFHTERYPTLWQMTSTVTGQTKASLTDIFRALFPCASITGAPKVSTMRIIDELETTPRNIYTGSIGYFAPQRKASFNVAIRTALIDRETKKAEYGVGGGIVWDSTSSDEYGEALLKARVLTESQSEFSLLETMLWTPEEGFFLKQKHIARLLDSADYFDFPTKREEIEKELTNIQLPFSTPQRVRLLLDKQGKFHSETTPYHLTEKILQVRLAKSPINSNNVFLFHKTTAREVYDAARTDFPECDDVLLYNERGELTEFTIGNLVVELDGQLVTPPTKCGLLAGTFRAHLVETGQVVERVLLGADLQYCTKIFRVNSIRKWETVQGQQSQ